MNILSPQLRQPNNPLTLAYPYPTSGFGCRTQNLLICLVFLEPRPSRLAPLLNYSSTPSRRLPQQVLTLVQRTGMRGLVLELAGIAREAGLGAGSHGGRLRH